MKILITGRPGIGKSTVLSEVIRTLSDNTFGIIAHELRDKNEQRVGFRAEMVQPPKTSALFAHSVDIQSDVQVDIFSVDVNVIDTFVLNALHPEQEKGVAIIDEIGRMQSFSKPFMKRVQELINHPDYLLVASIVSDPEPWSLPLKNNLNIILIEVTDTNREQLPELISLLLQTSNQIHQLSMESIQQAKALLREYFEKNQFIQINKLLKNAIPYILEEQFRILDQSTVRIQGFTREHLVSYSDKHISCDCDLFLGEGEYQQPGECSHIQAVKLLLADQ